LELNIPSKPYKCVSCRNDYEIEEYEADDCCPSCNTKFLPMSNNEELTLTLNKFEIMLLLAHSIWSPLYKDNTEDPHKYYKKAVDAIEEKLMNQHPTININIANRT